MSKEEVSELCNARLAGGVKKSLVSESPVVRERALKVVSYLAEKVKF